MVKPLIAITIHKIPRKAFCGVVVLVQQPDRSWIGQCSRCGEEFYVEGDPQFEFQVQAIRN